MVAEIDNALTARHPLSSDFDATLTATCVESISWSRCAISIFWDGLPKPARADRLEKPRGETSGTHFQAAETHFRTRETRFHAAETSLDAGEASFRTGETRFQTSETRFRARETHFEAEETCFHAAETRFPGLET